MLPFILPPLFFYEKTYWIRSYNLHSYDYSKCVKLENNKNRLLYPLYDGKIFSNFYKSSVPYLELSLRFGLTKRCWRETLSHYTRLPVLLHPLFSCADANIRQSNCHILCILLLNYEIDLPFMLSMYQVCNFTRSKSAF